MSTRPETRSQRLKRQARDSDLHEARTGRSRVDLEVYEGLATRPLQIESGPAPVRHTVYDRVPEYQITLTPDRLALRRIREKKRPKARLEDLVLYPSR